MPKKLTAASVYQKLVNDIRIEVAQGLKKIEELIEHHKVLSYWSIGRKINTYLTSHEQPRGAVGRFYQDLSKDLGINERTLQQCEQFYRYFPKLKVDKDLKWSHYRFLLGVADEGKRAAWITRIKKKNISADELRLALMPPNERKETMNDLKTPIRGKLFTYRLLRAEDIDNFDIPWFVDLGFANRHEAPKSQGALNNKYLYTSEKDEDGYRLKVVDAKASELFTFRGILRRVIDGDTLLVVVDQGFSYWTEQRLRLYGIDAPEIDTLTGARTKKWLEDELKSSKNIVVKTYKSDQWDRYLVDIFYLPKESDMRRMAAEGVWLNGRMLKKGVAKIWSTKPVQVQ